MRLLVALLFPLLASGQTDTSTLPAVSITRATVIAFWRVPSSNAELARDPSLASALDQQQYYWAATRDQLAALGVAAVGQPGRRFRILDGDRERVFEAPSDSAVVGYLLVEPGGDVHAIYRVQYPDQLTSAARAHFDLAEP